MKNPETHRATLTRINAGRTDYDACVSLQESHHAEVLATRGTDSPDPGRLIVTEHDPVITVTRRPDAPGHVLFSEQILATKGVALRPTNRGGDVTYHGPGQLVVYPILDLNRFGLRLHDYMRVLEQAVIDTLTDFGIEGNRDPEATGVWVQTDGALAKVSAMGVRVRRWVTMHGLSLNVDPDMSHFDLIVPCGLAGRPVTSLRQLLGSDSPTIGRAADTVAMHLQRLLCPKD